jgi:hypothetical protein
VRGTVYALFLGMRTFTTMLLVALTSTASAQTWRAPTNANLPQNRQPQTEERYQPRNQLADVRLEAGRERAFIRLPRTGRQIDYLELRAGRVPFTLIDVEVRFADGTSIHTGDRGLVEPFEGRVIDLPRRTSPVIAVVPRYQTRGRAPARLQVFGVRQHGRWNR